MAAPNNHCGVAKALIVVGADVGAKATVAVLHAPSQLLIVCPWWVGRVGMPP